MVSVEAEDDVSDFDNVFTLSVYTEQEVELSEVITMTIDEMNCEPIEVSCLTAYDRLVDGPADYKSILGTGE